MLRTRRTHWLAAILAVTGLAVVVAKTHHRVPSVAPPTPSMGEMSELLLTGCAKVRKGPVCEVAPDQQLRLWCPGAIGTAAFETASGERIGIAATEEVASGVAYFIEARDVLGKGLVARVGGRTQPFAIAPHHTPPELARAQTLRGQGNPDGAEAELSRLEGTTDPGLRAGIDGLRARMALRRGDLDQAVSLFRRSIASHDTSGNVSQWADDSCALAYTLATRQHRLEDAQEVLDALGRIQGYPEGRANGHYYSGLVASQRGDLRAALRLHRFAVDAAERAGMVSLRSMATEQVAMTLRRLGHAEEAVAMHRTLPEPDGGCDLVEFCDNRAWLELLAGDLEGANRTLATGLSVAECTDPFSTKNALLTRTLVELRRGDTEAATRGLARAHALPTDGSVLWELDLTGRLATMRSDLERAQRAFEKEYRLARERAEPEAMWRADVGLARVRVDSGDTQGAITLLERAEKTLDHLVPSIPLHTSPDRYFDDRTKSAVTLMRLLLDAGRPSEAMRVVRHARRRTLASLARVGRLADLDTAGRARWDAALRRYRQTRERLEADQQDDWQRTGPGLADRKRQRERWIREMVAALDEAHASLEPSTASARAGAYPERAMVVIVVAEGRGFTALGKVGSRVEAASSATSPEAPIASLFSELLHALPSCNEIYVLEGGALPVDVHAIEVDGRPLVETHTIAYALDLTQPRSTTTPGAPLVVVDPNGDLPRARREATTVAAHWPRAVILEGARATRSAFLERLSQAPSLHVAGHAQFSGTSDLESGLFLADGRVTVGDVLSVTSVPEHVVLSACEGARTSDGKLVAGWGIGHAFVMKGTQSLVAPTRVVSDELALTFATALYGAANEADRSPAASLRRAQTKLRAQHPDLDWAAYRVLVP